MRDIYTLDWVLDLLEKHRIIDAARRRDIELQAPQQRARLFKARKTDASDESMRKGGRNDVSPAELIGSLDLTDSAGGRIDEDRIAQVVAYEAKLPYYKIDPLALDMGLITKTLSRPFAVRHVVLPVRLTGAELTVAVENPFNPELTENLRRIHQGSIRHVVSSKHDIVKAITEIYGFRQSVESAARESRNDLLYDFEQLVTLRHVGDIEASDQHIVNAVDFLFRYAFDQRASDIHIEPRRDSSQVRLRIDGVLHDTHTIPRQVHPAVIARIKTLARMDIAEKRRPQDGRIKTVMRGRPGDKAVDKSIELRVSTLPVAFGEKIVIRIFDPEVLLQDLHGLGFDPQDFATFDRWTHSPNGLILVTGPTGSGKTTTLYSVLTTLAEESVNLTTVEDPIEMVAERFNQVAVQPKIGLDFAATLRSILRQDPDIIMVGEIRDSATAEMAVQSALTGHLVFSTLHTNDSIGAVTRLLDLSVPPFLLGSTLLGVMAQRLVRRICVHCQVPEPLTADQFVALGISDTEADRFAGTSIGTGCVECRSTGYFGRVGVFELFDIDADTRLLVSNKTSEDVLRQAGQKRGMRTLRECALERLAQGVTTFEEVVRVTARDASSLAAIPFTG